MKEYFITLAIAVIYALIRAKHDSFVSNGPWKTYAFLEGVYFAVLAALGLHFIYDTSWVRTATLPVITAFSFWIMFDGMSGIFRAGKFLYFGSGRFDQFVEGVFKGKAWAYLFFKSFWLSLITLIYFFSFD